MPKTPIPRSNSSNIELGNVPISPTPLGKKDERMQIYTHYNVWPFQARSTSIVFLAIVQGIPCEHNVESLDNDRVLEKRQAPHVYSYSYLQMFPPPSRCGSTFYHVQTSWQKSRTNTMKEEKGTTWFLRTKLIGFNCFWKLF